MAFVRNALAFSNENIVRNFLSLKCKNNFKLGTDQHEITSDKLSKSLTSSISCANIILFLLDMPTPGQWRLLSCEANPGCGRYDSAHLCSFDCPSGALGSVSARLMISVALHPWNFNACLQHCLQECCGNRIGLGFACFCRDCRYLGKHCFG